MHTTQTRKPKIGEVRLFVAAGLFILLTLLKLIVPSFGNEIKETITPLVEKNVDYSNVFSELGARLTGKKGDDVVVTDGEAQAEPRTPETDLAPKNIYEVQAQLTRYVPELSDAGVVRTPPSDTAGADDTPEVVAAFLQSQTEYSDYAVPTNVSYDMPALGFSFTSPVAGYTSSGFGYRLHPLEEEVRFHFGTDFAANTGEAILSFADGTVYAVGENDGYGLYIIIEHADGIRTLYGHCSAVSISQGDSVTMGQQIGNVGQTGNVTGPHLHFELIISGLYYNPEFYLQS